MVRTTTSFKTPCAFRTCITQGALQAIPQGVSKMVELTTLSIARLLLVAAVLKALKAKALVLKVTSSKSLA